MTSPADPHTKTYCHINGSCEEKLDRFAVSELCKGWPLYRDASEWKNFRSLFAGDAIVWTTWSGPLRIDDFIQLSKEAKEQGDFILHRECGTLVELSRDCARAVGKMKATITQRFSFEAEFDVDCDCRFVFFCRRAHVADAAWEVKYVKLFYEKDRIVPVRGGEPPEFSAQELLEMDGYPAGYRHLGMMQRRLGHTIDRSLPTCGSEGWNKMYDAIEGWLDGNDIDLFWTSTSP